MIVYRNDGFALCITMFLFYSLVSFNLTVFVI
jgi:hypothetical protein